MRKIAFLCVFFILLSGLLPVYSQESDGYVVESSSSSEITFSSDSLSDSPYGRPVYPENDGKKHYLSALAGTVIFAGGLFTYNKFILRSGWTKVTVDYARHFYEHEQKWDHDWYWTNFVLHPYQGAMAYMSGRSNNLNKIESFGLALLEDFTWEYFCETNAPSKNDLVYSSIGAFPVGEMLYRLSLEAGEINSLLGYLVNPERMVSELFTKQRPRGTVGNIYDFSLAVNAGAAWSTFGLELKTTADNQNEVFPVIGTVTLDVVYNDPFGHDSNDPYSQFHLMATGGAGKGSGDGFDSTDEKIFHDVEIISDGMLFARSPDFGENRDTTVGLVMEYDFIWNNLVQLSSLAPGFAFKQRSRHDSFDIEWESHLAGIVLGTTEYGTMYRGNLSDKVEGNREYDYTIGGEAVLRWKIKSLKGASLGLDIHGYAMYEFEDQVQEFTDTGWDLIGLGTLNAEVPLSKVVRMGVKNVTYFKKAFYQGRDGFDTYQLSDYASVYAKFQLK